MSSTSIRSLILSPWWVVACNAPVAQSHDDAPEEQAIEAGAVADVRGEPIVADTIEAPNSPSSDSTSPLGPSEELDDETLASGGAAPQPASKAPEVGLGGAEPASHPLFGEGSFSGVDPNDPCTSEQFWKVETAIQLSPGTVVIYDDKLWKLTGEANENWALEECTPPGTGWCADQYAWQEVGSCSAGQ